MNVAEIITRVKRQFGDESGVQVTDADIIRWINDAQLEICATNNLLETIATADILTGLGEYGMPDDILSLRSVRINGQKLVNISLQEAENTIDNFDDPSSQPLGSPSTFWVWATKIILYPIPDAASTGGLKLYYTRRPAAVVADTDPLELDTVYHPRLVEYCLQQAYELDEDWTAAGAKEEQFSKNLASQIDDEKWTDRSSYPRITVMPEDM